MSLSDLASLGSFVSGVAVLVTLIFLTLQVRQAERSQRAIVQQERAARLSDLNLRLGDAALSEVYDKCTFGDDDISLTQLRQYRRLVRAELFSGEDTFRLHKAGLLSNDVLDGYRSNMKGLAAQPGWRVMWKEVRVAWRSEFREFIDQIVAETPVATRADQLANWKAAMAGERDKA